MYAPFFDRMIIILENRTAYREDNANLVSYIQWYFY